jgi:hypothetical protein
MSQHPRATAIPVQGEDRGAWIWHILSSRSLKELLSRLEKKLKLEFPGSLLRHTLCGAQWPTGLGLLGPS